MGFFDSVKSILFPAPKPKSKNVITRTSKTYNTYTAPKSTSKSTNNYSQQLLASNGLSTMNTLQRNSGITATIGVAKPISQQITPASVKAATPVKSEEATNGQNNIYSDTSSYDSGSDMIPYDTPSTPSADFSGYQAPQISPEIQAQMDKWNQLNQGLSTDEIAQLQGKADTDAKTQNAEQRAYYDQLLKGLGDAKNDQLNVLNNNLNRAISSSQEQAFLNALKAQQDSAARGMSGQAVSIDAALRNNMESQRAMGDTYATSDQNIKSLLDNYNKNVGDINTEKGKLNDSVTAQKLFEAYQKAKLGEKSDQANGILDYIKAVAPYAMPDANTSLSQYAKMAINNSDLDMKRQQLAADITKNQNDYQIKASDAALGWANYETKIEDLSLKRDQWMGDMQNDTLKMQAQFIDSRMKGIEGMLAKDPDKSTREYLTQQYNALQTQFNQLATQDFSTP